MLLRAKITQIGQIISSLLEPCKDLPVYTSALLQRRTYGTAPMSSLSIY